MLYSAYVIILDLIIIMIFGDDTNYGLRIMRFPPQHRVICSLCDPDILSTLFFSTVYEEYSLLDYNAI